MTANQKFTIFGIVLIAIFLGLPGVNGNVHEKKLLSNLFSKYKAELRPVYYPQDNLKVKLGIALVALLELNVKEEYMTAHVWIRLGWKDASLKWDEAQFGNISVLRVRPTMTWFPDLIVGNTDDEHNKIPKRTNVLIYPSGEMLWVPPVVFKVKCVTDPTFFPFDQQSCVMKFESASYNGREISFAFYNDKPYVDLTDYWKNDQWQVVEVPAFHNVYQSPTEVYTTEDLTFFFTFKRRMTNYVVTLLLLSIMLAVITILPFILPDEKSEKLILELGSLVGALIILMHVRTVVANSQRSIIAKYLLTVVALNLISIVCTVCALYFNITHKPMPNWVQKYILEYLSKIFVWRRRTKKSQAAPPSSIEDASESNVADADKTKDEDKIPTSNEDKWRLLALIMDRGLLVTYLLIILISTIVLFSKQYSPAHDEDTVIRKSLA